MRLVHTTTRDNLASIMRDGLLTSCSTGKRPDVWLHVSWKNTWAEAHVRNRHKDFCTELVHIEVDVPEDVRTYKYREGVYYTLQDIPASAINKVFAVKTMLSPIM